MNFWLTIILKLYPQTWRVRYEDEFRAMLELCDLSFSDWFDMTITAVETRTGHTRRRIMKDLLNRVTGMIALVSALSLLTIFIIPDEDTAEFMFFFAPMLSILLIPAMHRILKIHKPNASFAVMVMGILAIALMICSFILGSVSELNNFIIFLTTTSLILVGLWMIAVNFLSYTTNTLPPILAVIGIIAGLGWIIVMTATIASSYTGFSVNYFPVIGALYGMAFISLLGGYFIWALGTAFYFISGSISRKLQPAY